MKRLLGLPLTITKRFESIPRFASGGSELTLGASTNAYPTPLSKLFQRRNYETPTIFGEFWHNMPKRLKIS